VAVISGVELGVSVEVSVGNGVDVGVDVNVAVGVGVAGASAGIPLHAVKSIHMKKAKYGNRFMSISS
jgi:hypothetical protein